MPTDDDNIDIVRVRGEGEFSAGVPMTQRTVYVDRTLRRNEELHVRCYVSDDGQVTVSIMGDDGEAIEAVTADRLKPEAA